MTQEQEQRIIKKIEDLLTSEHNYFEGEAIDYSFHTLEVLKKSGALDEAKEIWKAELIDRLTKSNRHAFEKRVGNDSLISKSKVIQIIKEL